PFALFVDGHMRSAKANLHSEVRAHLPRILGVKFVVVEAIVANRRLCAVLHVGELSDQQIAPIVPRAVPLPVVESDQPLGGRISLEVLPLVALLDPRPQLPPISPPPL